MFFSTRKRSVVLAAPLLLFSIACTSEVGTTPTPIAPTVTPTSVAPADTPTPTTVPPTATSTLTPTLTLQDQLLQERVVLQELVAARATATALTPTPTPTPTVAVPVQWQLQPLQPLPTNTPTPMAGSPAETGNRVGNLAPDFTLTEVSTGQPVQLAQLTEQGRPVVIYFFTTW